MNYLKYLGVLSCFLLLINHSVYGQGPCGSGPCEVCGVSATITSITGGTINNGTSSIPGQVQAGQTGLGSTPLDVTANTCGEIKLHVELNFDWDHGQNSNWIHGISFDNSPGWSAANGVLPGPGWLFQNSITGVCSGTTYGAGYYYDPPGTGPDTGNNSSYDGTNCPAGNAGYNEATASWLVDGDPSDNFGDDCQGNCPSFGFNLTYCPITGGSTTENISFYLTEDGETGGWVDSDQCIFLLSFEINLNSAGIQLPKANTICAGECTTLDAGMGCDSYLWSTNETTPSITVCPTATTMYSVTVTGSTGCVIDGETEVVVEMCCGADAGMLTATPTTACPGEIINFSATGYNMDPTFTQVLLVADNTGNIVQVINGDSGTLTSLVCEGFTIYSYNYLTNGGSTVPIVGGNVNALDCSVECCALVSIPVTFEDTENPAFPSAPADENLNCSDQVMPMTDLTWTDNCDGTGMVAGMETGSIDMCIGGTIMRTWEYTDACGNTATHTQNITAAAITPPTFQNIPANTTVACDAAPSTFPDLMYSNGGGGGCLIEGMVSPTVVGSSDACGGMMTAEWNFTDVCGNVLNANQTVMVDPAPAPTFINPPGDMTVECDAIPTSAPDLNYSNNESGNCLIEGMVSPVQSGTADNCGGTITFNWDIVDACGNDISHAQIITVNPAPPATFINPPQDITVSCDAIPTSAPDLSFTNNQTGNCEISGMVSPVQNGTTDACGGGFSYTWTSTDNCGNPINYTQNITVTPAATTVFLNPPPDLTVDCDAVPTSADPLNYSNGAVGSCLFEGSATPVMDGTFDDCGGGTITFTWEVTDPCGTPIIYIQTITVNPASPPAFTSPLPADFTTDCSTFTNNPPTLNYSNNGAGNCLVEGNIIPTQTGSYNECGGSITYTWEVTDNCGSTLSHDQEITIDPAPIAVFTSTLPQDFTTDCDNFSNNPQILNYSNSQTGTCLIEGSITAQQQGSFDECGGTITYVWMFIDACGRDIEHEQVVTIDPALPVSFINPPGPAIFTCGNVPSSPPTLSYNNNQSGVCNISGSVTAIQSGSFDNCGGTIVYTWTFTDNCNRPITHSQNVTVTPASEPMWIDPPADVTINCGQNLPLPDPLSYSNGENGLCEIAGSVPPMVTTTGLMTTYFWSFTNSCSGITITHTQLITETPEPIISINPEMLNICEGEIFDLTSINVIDQNGSPLTVTYHSGTPANTSNQLGNTNVNPSVNTTYYILGTNQFGCSDEAPFTINVEMQPNAGMDGSGSICFNQSFNVNLFDYIVGPYDPNGTWQDFNGYGVNLNDPQNVNLFPLAPGTVSFNYAVPGLQYCPPEVSTIAITIQDEIAIDILSVECTGTDLYTIVINNQDNFVIVGTAGTADNSTPGMVTISDIPITSNIVITVLDPDNLDCFFTQSVSAPDCNCPSIDPPISDGNLAICEGESIPALSVTVPAGQTANWYDAATGGTALITGSLTYTPTTSGPGIYQYFVEAEELSSACVSLTRTPIQLEINPLPNAMDASLEICDDDLDGFALFTLTDAQGDLSNSTGVGFTFYPTLVDAQNGTNALTTSFVNTTNPQTIYVAVENGAGCIEFSSLTLEVLPLPNINLNIVSETCLDAADGSVEIVGTSPGDSVSLDGLMWQITNTFSGLASGSYFAFVKNANGCINSQAFTIDPGLTLSIQQFDLACQDNGTPSDASDDFFIITFELSNSNASAGNYELYNGTALLGTYSYDLVNTIQFPADGTTITLNFVDLINSCTIDQVVGPLNSCSTNCTINIDQLDFVCNDNGTDLDASDDFYTISINASAVNGAANNSYNVLINGAVSYNFQYNIISTFTLPADASSPLITVVDNADLQCSSAASIGPLTPCSDGCLLVISNIDLTCDDNGTITDPTDDFYTIDVNTTATNPGISNQFEVFADLVSLGVFPYGAAASFTLPATGNSPVIQVQDFDEIGCMAEQTIGPLSDCAGACTINASFDNIECSDNGTGNDPADDTFTFEVTVTGTNTGSSWTSNTSQTGTYNSAIVFGPFLISDGSQSITITDDLTGTCTTTFTVNPPTPCSDPCVISISNTTLNCDDNGTLTDPSDDFYSTVVSTNVINGGSSGQYEAFVNNVSIGIFNHGTDAMATLPADGSSPIISVQDLDFPACSSNTQIGPLTDCADACILNATTSNVQCNDNNTGNDPSDDTFTFQLEVSGTNVGSTWTATGGYGGMYNSLVTFGPYLISDGPQTIVVNDDVTGSCITTVTVDPPNSCSDPCELTIVNIDLACDDNGSLTDPTDDFYIINITSNVTFPGSSNQYEVLVDGIVAGTFDHGNIGMITLPANGSSPIITLQDLDFNSCSDNQQIGPLDNCASACLINASFSNVQCDDNGTGNDPLDDTFTVEVTVTGSNIGSNWSSNVGVNGTYNTPSIFGPFPIAAGTQIINITDDITGSCTTSLSIDAPLPCSDPCNIQFVSIDLTCDENGTATDPIDDFYLLDIATSVTAPGNSGQYEVFVNGLSSGIFSYGTNALLSLPADGSSPVISVSDIDFPDCMADQTIGPLQNCAVACIINAAYDMISCDDNGTGNDPLDDTFTVEVTVTGSNVGTGWSSNVGTNGMYDMPTLFGPFSIASGTQTIVITDDVTGNCTTSLSIDPPAACSDPCAIQIVNIDWNCDDNGTNTDPSDDFYLVNITADVTVPGSAGLYEVFVDAVSFGTFPYGTIAGITLPASGASPIININDVDFPACMADQTIGPLQSCGVTCDITATVGTINCNDNGTGNDPLDDTFTFELTLSGTNTGTGWTESNGTTGNYNMPITFGPYLIFDGIQTLDFNDNLTTSCATSIQVSPPATCSDCIQMVDAGIGGEISCTDTLISLAATSSEPGNYLWTGPANFNLLNSLTAQVTQPGFYFFEATFTDGCTVIDSVEVIMDNTIPMADGGPDATLTCEVLLDTLVGTVGPNQEAQWFDSNNDIVSSTNILVVNNPGTFYYQVTDIFNGCSSALDEVNVIDGATIPDAIIIALPTDVLNCVIVSIELTSTPQDNVVYTWSVIGELLVAPEITISQAGTYELIATDTISGCIATDDIVISNVEEYPIISINPADEISCYQPDITIDATNSQSGPTIIYSWLDITGTPIPGANGNTLTVENGGTYFLELIDTMNGCKNIDTVVVETLLNAPLANAGGNINLPCDETQTSLNLSIQGLPGSANISWSTVDGSITSGATTPNPAVNGIGYYYVNIQDIESGCETTDSVYVGNNPDVPEVALLELENESCINFQNGSLNVDNIFGGQPPYTYTLNGQQSSTNAIFDDLAPGFYSLNILDFNGCEMDTSFTIEPGVDLELSLPAVIELMQNEPGFIEGVTNVDPNELSVIQWTPDNLVSCDSCLTTQVFGEDGQDYTLRIIHENGCSAIASIRLLVRPDVQVYIPNAFSPNNDGNNDAFTLFANEQVDEILELIIVDRWGEIIFRNENFEPNNLSLGWDGSLKGVILNPAVFVYVFKVKLLDGTERQFSGDVTLMK